MATAVFVFQWKASDGSCSRVDSHPMPSANYFFSWYAYCPTPFHKHTAYETHLFPHRYPCATATL